MSGSSSSSPSPVFCMGVSRFCGLVSCLVAKGWIAACPKDAAWLASSAVIDLSSLSRAASGPSELISGLLLIRCTPSLDMAALGVGIGSSGPSGNIMLVLSSLNSPAGGLAGGMYTDRRGAGAIASLLGRTRLERLARSDFDLPNGMVSVLVEDWRFEIETVGV